MSVKKNNNFNSKRLEKLEIMLKKEVFQMV
jgi:hypothetical protein